MSYFLDLPKRSSKPRAEGITHVIDPGIGLSAQEDLVKGYGEFIDIVKLGWGTSYIDSQVKEKISYYQRNQIEVYVGGTLFELSYMQGQLDKFRAWLESLNLKIVEVSDGILDLPPKEKTNIIREFAQDFKVLSEVGSKDVEKVVAPYRWVEAIERELEAGSWRVITEGRESGTAGIYRPTGEIREGLIEEILTKIPAEKIIFEAPRKEQQVWFILNVGREVNLGNIATKDVLSVETLRRGLRADTIQISKPSSL
jgi:phosphosulfolactate synthase